MNKYWWKIHRKQHSSSVTLAGIVNSFWQLKTHLHVMVIGSRSICVSMHWRVVSTQVIFQWEWHYNQPEGCCFLAFFLLFLPPFSHTWANSGVCRTMQWRLEGERKVLGPGGIRGGGVIPSSPGPMAELCLGNSEASCMTMGFLLHLHIWLHRLPCPSRGPQGPFAGTAFFSGWETGSLHHSISISLGLNIYIHKHHAEERLNYLLHCINWF